MEEVIINIDETVEEILVISEETVEEIQVHITEAEDVVINLVEETADLVEINIDEVIEEVLVEITEAGPAHQVEYKIVTMPAEIGPVIYTGFATDSEALTGDPKWAVKRLNWLDEEAWAGKDTFDQILDNYLSLTYI